MRDREPGDLPRLTSHLLGRGDPTRPARPCVLACAYPSAELTDATGPAMKTLAKLPVTIVTGFLGALTTFSSFSAEVIALLQDQRFAQALGWCAIHLLGSLCMTWLGLQSIGMIWPAARA